MRTGVVVATGSLIFASTGIAAATLSVPQQFSSIQSAVDAASPGDTVLVGPGHYIENVAILKSLTLRSAQGATRTTIDGNGIGAPVAVAGTSTEIVTITGFTLTGGAYLLEPQIEYPGALGAGVYIDSVAMATVSDNIVTGNRGCGGSGIRSFFSSIEVRRNVVRANEPMDWCGSIGDGLRLDGHDSENRSARIEHNHIVDNGGIGITMVAFTDVVIRGNTITDNGMSLDNISDGAGLWAGGLQGIIANNFFSRNVAWASPAMLITEQSPQPVGLVITGNVFADNVAVGGAGYVGAISLSIAPTSHSLFQGNVVIGDSPEMLVSCAGSTARARANLVINRNPAGAGVVGCSP